MVGRRIQRAPNSPKMVTNMIAKSPKWLPKSQNWSPKMTSTWHYRQDFANFPLNYHYHSVEPSHVNVCRNEIAAILAALRSGHSRAQPYVLGRRVYPPCPNCNVTQATPVHILAYIGCLKSQLLSSPLFKNARVHGIDLDVSVD
ncbi:hypothetical protein TNCV_3850481 [Trichonephila clavipes]|nr:hypothetical protein TNCV_3850481 [Trichonephila clavipes]